jgi:hypothetical protein
MSDPPAKFGLGDSVARLKFDGPVGRVAAITQLGKHLVVAVRKPCGGVSYFRHKELHFMPDAAQIAERAAEARRLMGLGPIVADDEADAEPSGPAVWPQKRRAEVTLRA